MALLHKNSEDLSVTPKDVNKKEIQDAYAIANTSNYTEDELEAFSKEKKRVYLHSKKFC
ncbi:MAG: hypothetical protein Q9M40_10880 [Sulfurimonas sp.]|nr:hypothetical protein [Sulfurimonas sp.]